MYEVRKAMKKFKRAICKTLDESSEYDLLDLVEGKTHLRIYVKDNETGETFFVVSGKTPRHNHAIKKESILRTVKLAKSRKKR